uniref:Ycf2 n=1 Tax=Gymnomitrion concinnatum TaxID=209793 RepID=A0A3G6XMB6_9MARC|nr:Ycf2 [Gymnomitrion concinnatum]AZB86843.1 Ycf2 [Gymnomitrion concinnatum]
MKQKFPEKKYSYKNLYLSETRKTKILSNSWTKCSLIKLLIAKFFDEKIVHLFNFQIITLSMDSRNLGRNDNFILNGLILFALPVYFFIYRSNPISIVEIRNFTLTKVHGQTHSGKNSIGIYKKSFQKFENLLQNIFRRKKKLSRYESFNIITPFKNPMFFERINNSFEKEMNELIYSLNFSKNFLDYYFPVKENLDYLWARKQILKNLANWGESPESLVKSSFSLKEKGNLYLSNYMKLHLWQFFTKNYPQFDRIERKILTEKTLNYFYSELKNPKFLITLENILSEAIYKFSKYLAHKTRESDIQIGDIPLSTEEVNKDINLLRLDSEKKRNLQFIRFNQFDNSYTHNFHFDWINRMLYLKYTANSKSIFIKRTFLNKSSFSVKTGTNSNSESCKKYLTDNYIINNLFSKKKIEKVNPNFFVFFEPLLIDEFTQTIISAKTFTRFSENLKKINHLRNNIESDDLEIISWKLRKYHSNFLRNYSLPFNFAYNRIYQNSPFGKEIWYRVRKKYNRLFAKILDLSPLFLKFRKSFSLMSCIGLKEHLLIKTNKLDIVMDQLNETEEASNFIRKILIIFGKGSATYNSETKSIDDYCTHYNQLLEKTLPLKILDSKNIYRNKIFHKYSISWKRFMEKSFIYNVKKVKYQKLGFDISYWLYEMRNSSKTFAPHKLMKFFKEYFPNSGSENITEITNSLQISANIRSGDIEQNELLTQTLIENFKLGKTNPNNSVDYLLIHEIINDEIIGDLLNTFSTKNYILLDWIRNKKIFLNLNYKFHLDNPLINFNSNYEENFLFYWEKNDTENNRIIYSQLLKNLLKYNQLNDIFINKKYLFLGREISQFVQLKLNKISVFETFNNKLDKTKFLSFLHSYRKILQQTKFDFSERKQMKLETIFTNKELETKKISLADLNNTKIERYYNLLRSESFTGSIKTNNFIFRSLNKIDLSQSLKYSKLENLGNRIGKKILIQTDEVYNKSNQIKFLHCFERDILVKDSSYIDWFFTYGWWEYSFCIFGEGLRKRFVIIGSYFEYFVNNYIKLIQKNLSNLYKEGKNLYTLDSRWNLRLFFDRQEENILNFSRSDFHSINNLNNLHWAIFSLIAFVFSFYQNFFSIFLGSDSIGLWKHFENIKYLMDTSRAFYFTELLHRNKIQLNKTENLLIYFFSNLKDYAKNIRFYLLTKRDLNNWLINNKSLDLSRRKRNLLVQSLITHTRIKEYGFQSYSQPKILNNPLFGYRRNPQQGLSYIRYLSKILKKDLVNYSLHLADKWIFFASLQKIMSSQTLQQAEKFNPKFQKIPISLQLGLSCSKGVLLIGPMESGRSYLIKNLAADCSVPLFGISINKLMYNKPDVMTESWMNILIESLRRLNLTLDLAKGMSPCIIWIRNIHELDVNRSTQNIESDPTFLLGILLKHFQTNSLKTGTKNNIVMIGSTHVPKKVDPSLISPDRLDRVLNIRFLNTYQRKNQFPILLNKSNLQLNKNLLYFSEFGSRTLGYNIRDLVALNNEISLISLTKNKSFVCNDIVKLAFHRQVFGFSHTDNKSNYRQNFKILLYRIGRAIIQNIMIKGSTTNPLNISNYLWKKKFYYLSKWYSEPSMDESIIKESTILVHVLVCLAGAAARDSWFLLEKNSHTSISLDKSIENDLDLAFSILETFSSDFPWLETCETPFLNYEGKKPKIFLTKNFLNIMHSGISAVVNKGIMSTQINSHYESLFSRNKILNQKMCEFGNTAWSPRFWRLNFSRSHLFNWIKKPNDFESLHSLGFFEKRNVKRGNKYDQSINRKKEQLFYERILPRVRKRNVEELESQFENILLEEQFEILGFFGPLTQYHMEYQLDNKQKLFIGKRILWDPVGSLSRNRHFVFSQREFFVDEEMLRRLYITYGVRRERERSLSSKRIKRFFICRGYNKDLINNLSIRWWNQLPIDQKQNISTLKRIEKIGIQLKRPQIFTPVYLYQRWLIENIPEKFSRLDLLTHRDRWIKINKLLLNDSPTYNILLESYQYLFDFFLSNRILLTQMTKTLLRKKWIFQNEIIDIIDNIENAEC